MNYTFVAHLGDAVLGHEVGGLRVDEALVKPSLPGRRGVRLDSDGYDMDYQELFTYHIWVERTIRARVA